MCSIAGNSDRVQVKKMLKVMRHRAPDDEGIIDDGRFAIGMGRLSIIDLKSKNLCPHEEDGLVLSYNGEIYNYLELRQELKKRGWNFRTNSDTEVLLKCFREWGLKMFDRLNGMFAFAIYDKRKQELLLARDIAGEKPLYYYRWNGQFAFASEAKAFQASLNLTREPNEFLEAFQHCNTSTPFREVKLLPAASFMTVDLKTNTSRIKPYWEFKPRDIDSKNCVEELESLLADAVKIRTRSDVPYALYYSGGIDSSLISILHNFRHKFYFDDLKNWKKDFFKKIDDIIWHLDFPVGSLSSYPLFKLAETASRKVKVVISGEGADEIFGGYVRYLPVAREWELRRKFPSYNSLFSRHFPTYLDGFAHTTARNENVAFVKTMLKPYFDMFSDPINAMGFADFKLVLPSLLQMGDRMAAAFGLENRCPFLDRRIIEFGFSLPPEWKISGLELKVILRRVLAKRGLLEPLTKEKKGLTIVFNKWLGKNDWDRGIYFDLLKRKWSKVFA